MELTGALREVSHALIPRQDIIPSGPRPASPGKSLAPRGAAFAVHELIRNILLACAMDQSVKRPVRLSLSQSYDRCTQRKLVCSENRKETPDEGDYA